MKKSSIVLAAVATLGICAFLSNGAQFRNSPFIQEKKESFHSFGANLGFSIPSNFEDVHIIPNDKNDNDWHFESYRYVEKGKLNHYSDVYDALLESSDDPDLYLYVYRVTLEPHQVRDYGFLGFGSSGDDWVLYNLQTTVEFQKTIIFGPQNIPQYQILNFAPMNQPTTWSDTIGFDIGGSSSGPSVSVSASVSYNHSELSVYSETSVGDPYYETGYLFRPMGNVYSLYLQNTVYCYGMVLFRYHYNVDLVVKHNIQYRGVRWYDLGNEGKVTLGYHLRNR